MSPTPPKLLFLATEDWFFASHFLPMLRAARAAGLSVTVATRFARHRAAIEAEGARTVDLDMERGAGRALGPARALWRTVRLLREERPDIVHAISLRAVLLGGLARRIADSEAAFIQAVTGLGVVGADSGPAGRTARFLFRQLIRGPFEMADTFYLFENEADARWLRLSPEASNVVLVAGAGVDPAAYPATPLPGEDGPLRIALVARMLWSKGVDLAVEAVTRARAAGGAIELSLYGAPDPANPRAVPLKVLEEWGRRDGIRWHGHTSDVAEVWRSHHVACLPSRGGEGLPRTLLEAASCGRPLLATDVPGCSLFLRDGCEGRLVPPDDPEALAGAMLALAGDRDALRRMGEAAAARLRAGFTEDHVAATVEALYRRILAGRPR
ncbi:glycosyl transferase family 1 [Aureimonas endophytica]|uniref:Glycosyl transferase family 1 n=1 Tax=Aureimonas endophytica TaxID=2027858 RepID=A0A917E9N8_9HYPH|nr:glycosyltransferase family 4 protein [Aureimonas endophytica]GGE17247.1 glycosyl transferase family 1 [Aureimonas endophytica]